MEDERRPEPEALLALAKKEEERKQKGQLTIFLGYAPGVGKTYAMLQAAHELLGRGLIPVVAYIETHGRKETEDLLEGLEIIPPKIVEYHGIRLKEMDLDTVIKRKPILALVDEFAHTNAEGSKNVKRYQDVQEMLDNGINVYTTLNIQHIESLNDVVAKITGIKMRESVPDTAIENADLKLVDLPPEELLVRLKNGKVYVPDMAERAIHEFFRLGNLIALREMTLRFVAAKVNREMDIYMNARSIPGPWAAADKLLVCVSPSPFSAELIRTTKRLANDLNAEWHAIYVNTSNSSENSQLEKNLKLAEELGAKVVRMNGRSVAKVVADYAFHNNITKIVVGKPLMPKWKEFFRGKFVDEIIRHTPGIDVYVVSSNKKYDL